MGVTVRSERWRCATPVNDRDAAIDSIAPVPYPRALSIGPRGMGSSIGAST